MYAIKLVFQNRIEHLSREVEGTGPRKLQQPLAISKVLNPAAIAER